MRGPLLLFMDNFNDWDLQAVVRSCSSARAEEPAGARHAAAARGAEANAPAPPPDVAVQERRAPAAPAIAVAKQGASRTYGLEYLDSDHRPFLPPPGTAAAASRGAGDDAREVMISFPAASTSGVQQPRAVPPGRKAGARTPPPRPKRSKKSQLKKVVREMPVAEGGVSSSDPWAWRKYGQKPIKGSPYPRGYYKCSSMKGCMARKLVERSPAKPGVLIVTYMAEHCHPVPTQLNALAGTTRHTKSSSAAAAAAAAAGGDYPAAAASSPKSQERRGLTADEAARCDADSNEGGGAEEAAALAGDESEAWSAGMDLDELLATTVDDDFDFEHVLDDNDDGVLGRRLSL